MVEHFRIAQAVVNQGRLVCPPCKNHVQGDRSYYLDCKNLFTDNDGNVASQCRCYGLAHGRRI
jgi:hypothetical protein